jgi:hypothetical protein
MPELMIIASIMQYQYQFNSSILMVYCLRTGKLQSTFLGLHDQNAWLLYVEIYTANWKNNLEQCARHCGTFALMYCVYSGTRTCGLLNRS